MNKNVIMVLAVIVALLSGWLLLELASVDVTPKAPATVVSNGVNLGPPGPVQAELSVTIAEQPFQVSVDVR